MLSFSPRWNTKGSGGVRDTLLKRGLGSNFRGERRGVKAFSFLPCTGHVQQNFLIGEDSLKCL